MTFELSEDLQAFVAAEVRAGHYPSEREAIADAVLRLKEDREREVWLRTQLAEASLSVATGQARPWDAAATLRRLGDRLEAEGRASS